MKTILYTDGGCSNNDQKDISKRSMVFVVTDNWGNVLIDKAQQGGSNNIAELLAVREALTWVVQEKRPTVEIRTDSRNNFAWVLGKKVGKHLNDRTTVLAIKNVIDGLRQHIELKLVWVPRKATSPESTFSRNTDSKNRRPVQ